LSKHALPEPENRAYTAYPQKPATLAQLEAYCQAVRGLCAGEPVSWRGQGTRLLFEPQRVPIWIAAEGPRTQHLAGRIADGVIFANGITREVVEDNLGRVRAGALAAGRDPDSLECWFLVKPCFAESEQQAWHDHAWTLSASANHAFRSSFEDKFVPEEHRAGLERLMRGYASHQHNVGSSGSHNARLVLENDLTGFLGPRFLLAGSAPRIAERLEELASWGATNLILTILFGDPDDYARRLASEVLAPLRR
jgi:alkanesulfonate monooxygenase SsuD/methylene tetrahydromethanopterin reductase-like flavin-dependent oxidoreductase (luciferase family)